MTGGRTADEQRQNRQRRTPRAARALWLVCAAALLAPSPAAARLEPPEAPPLAGADMVDGPERMSGNFFDEEGLELDFDDLYWTHFHPEESHIGLAFAWQGLILGLGTWWYWANAGENAKDWEFPSFRSRLTGEAVRFDDNHFTINHVSHPFAGSAYYALARSAGMGLLGASGMAFLSSSIWEYGLEWREQVSLNDQFFTPLGGIAIGEGIYRLGHYFNSAPNGGGVAQRILAATIGAPVWFHRWYDDVVPPDGPTDNLGFSAAYHHRFRLAYARAGVDDGDTPFEARNGFGLTAELYAIPGLGRPGVFDVFFTEGNLFDIEAGATWDDDGVGSDWYMRVESVMIGYLTQDIAGEPDDPDTRWGTTVYVGSASGYEHVQQWQPEPRDRFAKVLLPGADAGIWLYGGPVVGHIRLSVQPSFDAIDSVAAPTWFERNPQTVVRSVLRRRGYYYGFGLGSRLQVELEMFDWLRVETEARFYHVESIEGLDREQEKLEVDPPIQDDMVRYRGAVVVTLPDRLLSLGLTHIHTRRWGKMERETAERSFDRFEATIGIEF